MARNFAAGNYLQIPSDKAFDGVAGGGATWSFWIKFTTTTANIVPMSRMSSGSRQGVGFIVNNPSTGKGTLFAYDTTAQRFAISTTIANLNNGNWRHIACVWDKTLDSNAQKVYVDGALDVQGTASGAWIMGANVIRIARAVDGFWGSLVGDMADICHWSAKLTAAEIAALAARVPPGRIRPEALELFIPCLD